MANPPVRRWDMNDLTIAMVAALTLVVVAIIVSIAGIYFTVNALNRLTQEDNNRYGLQAQAIAIQLESYLQQAQQITQTTTKIIGSIKDPAIIEQTLLNIVKTIPSDFYYGIGAWYAPFALDKNKYYNAPYAYFPSAQEPPIVTREFEGEHYHYFGFDWWTNTIEADGRLFYVRLFVDPFDGLTYISYSQGMFDNAGKFMGVLGVDLVPERFGEVVLATNQTSDSTLYLMNEQRQVFAHPNTPALFESARAQGLDPQTIFDVSGKEADALFQEQYGANFLAVEAKVPSSNWVVRLLVDDAVAYANVYTQNTNTLRALGVLWVGVAFGLVWLMRANRQIRATQANQNLLEKTLTEQRIIEKTLQNTNAVLEQRVKERTTALEVAKQEAESANQVKSAFLASMLPKAIWAK
jgi:hypothetical protein